MARELTPREQWTKAEAKSKREALEDRLAFQIRAMKLPHPVRQHRFHPERKWSSDFAWIDFMVLAEVEGVTFAGGRHQRIGGFEKDAEKYAAAQALGWTVLRLSPGMIRNGRGVRLIDDVLRRVAKAKGYL